MEISGTICGKQPALVTFISNYLFILQHKINIFFNYLKFLNKKQGEVIRTLESLMTEPYVQPDGEMRSPIQDWIGRVSDRLNV